MTRRTFPLLTFREKVEPIARLCHAVLEKHGERMECDLTRPGSYRGGYRFPAPVMPNSEADYALRILAALKIAIASTDRMRR